MAQDRAVGTQGPIVQWPGLRDLISRGALKGVSQDVRAGICAETWVTPVEPVVVGAGHEVRARGLAEAVARIQADVEAQEEVLCLCGHGGSSVEVFLTLGKAQCLADLG